MEKPTKPENLYIRRNKVLTAIAAVAFLAIAVAAVAAYAVAVYKNPIEDKHNFSLLTAAVALLGLAFLSLSAFNFRNLFFPFLLTADEKGIYDYSGFFHFGLIEWKYMGEMWKGSALLTILDLLDSEMPSIIIMLKTDLTEMKKELSFWQKWLLFWRGQTVKIYTLCSQVKKREIIELIKNMLDYYAEPEENETQEN